MVQLGEGMQRAPARSRDELVVRGDLEALVRSEMDAFGKRMEQLLRSMIPKAPPVPVVNVPAPITNVAAPQVNMTCEMPEMETAEIALELTGMADLKTEIAGLRADVSNLAALLLRPVTRTVTRNGDGLIVSITERRT